MNLFLLWKLISNCNHLRMEVRAVTLWIWSAETAPWGPVFLRSYNFGQNHLGNFLFIYSACEDLVNHAKNVSRLYRHFSFFQILVTLIISLDRHKSLERWVEKGLEFTDYRWGKWIPESRSNVPKVTQPFNQREQGLETGFPNLLLWTQTESQTRWLPSGLHQKRNCKSSREWNSTPGHTRFSLLFNVWLSSPVSFWSYMYHAGDLLLFVLSAWCLQKSEDGGMAWVNLLLICFKWNPIYKIHFTSFNVQLTN